ncbi:MAG: biopolymer transport protein ExbB [Lentimonas sp.]|jgi:biopolymer transport protein ExbB
MDLVTNVGVFMYPLMVCSLLAVFITAERMISLRTSKVIGLDAMAASVLGTPDQIKGDIGSTMGRIANFYREQRPSPEALIAFARMEVSQLERGLFLLEAVIGAAPLLGLLGTVTGLTQVFGNFFAENGLTNPDAFTSGIAMALNTTIIGLTIAIPSLVAHAYLLRRVDWLAARISMGVECLSKSELNRTAD